MEIGRDREGGVVKDAGGRRPPLLPIALAAGLSALVLLVYGRTGWFPFIRYDDDMFLVRNPAVAVGLTWESLRWAATTGMDAGWIPVTWLSRLLDVSLFGMDAGKHHLVNVAFHLANVLLLFHLFRRMTGALWKSALVAALFAVHPLHVESVAWVTERKDVLFAFFWLLSMLAYVRYAERPGAARYGAVLLFFALSLMSKPTAVTLPFALLLLDFWPLRRLRPWPRGHGSPEGEEEEGEWEGGGAPSTPPVPAGRLVLEKLPLLALSAAASVATLRLQEGIEALSPLSDYPLSVRVGNALLSYGTYLWKTLLPYGLAVFYPHPGAGLPWGLVFLSSLFLAAVTAVALRELRRRPWLAWGWFWYLGTLVPVIGLVQAGGKAMADRCTYVPLWGIYAIAAWGGAEALRRIRAQDWATRAACGLWLAALAAAGFVQAGYWRSDVVLFSRAAAATNGNWFAHASLGQAAFLEGRGQEALAYFREALRVRPELPEVHGTMGRVLERMGRLDEAVSECREEVRFQPGLAEGHYNLAVLLGKTGRIDEAMAEYGEALRLKPDFAEAHYNLAVCLAGKGREVEATSHFRDAVRLDPGDGEARRNLETLTRSPSGLPTGGRR